MNLKDLIPVIKNVAPGIATALGGPVAGVATKFLSQAFFGNQDATEDEVAIAIQSPDNLVKLKEIEKTFLLKMEQAGIDIKKIHAEDRANARDLAIKTTLWPQAILSGIYVIAFAVILVLVFTSAVDFSPEQRTIIGSLIGILSYGLAQIMNFWFGSSSGSKEKTAIMGRKGAS